MSSHRGVIAALTVLVPALPAQHLESTRAGLNVLRAPTQLLRSRDKLPDLEAVADARSGHPVPLATSITQKSLEEARLLLDASSSNTNGGQPEGCCARSARQQLLRELDACNLSVAVASARGGHSIPPATRPGPRPVLPVLDFPEPGLDDTAAYQGYQTRFYRDSKGNTVQIYLRPQTSRAVLVWANAANESVGFSVRDDRGNPAPLEWGERKAEVSDSAGTRTIEYHLTSPLSRLELGWFVLGSMRVERDFVYANRHLQPFSAPPFRVAEESLLVARLGQLPPQVFRRHLSLINASSLDELRSRLLPVIRAPGGDREESVTIERPSLDGRHRLRLELRVDPRKVKLSTTGRVVSLDATPGSPVEVAVRVTTDARSLTPLSRKDIFNRPVLDLLSRQAGDQEAERLRRRRLERQATAVELLSSEEKLMAGLPNFATYFGRDMMMTALMMRPIWSPAMMEHVIGSVLGKLGPGGEISHEEALGGQAIREHAVVYDSLLKQYFRGLREGQTKQGQDALASAETVLRNLDQTRENYHMMDDEFQLPVLAAWYLADTTISPDQKRSFLMTRSGGPTRLHLLLQELGLVASLAQPYVMDQRPTNLVSFPRLDATRWRSASWRDSDAGYARGRFAMDINVIWVPEALRSIGAIAHSFRELGISAEELDSIIPAGSGALAGYLRDPVALRKATDIWKAARRHFIVRLSADESRRRVAAKLAWLPAAERQYWRGVLSREPNRDSLSFLALSLDERGRPIPIVNTDPATGLFLNQDLETETVQQDVEPFLSNYPVGLFVEGLGPVVANDAYAPRDVWERFKADHYHGPRVVWGREVNLLLLGLANHVARGKAGLAEALHRIQAAVNASGLEHNELWSYEIRGGKLVPVRYGTSSDIQLWNTTDLAVEYVLSQLAQNRGE